MQNIRLNHSCWKTDRLQTRCVWAHHSFPVCNAEVRYWRPYRSLVSGLTELLASCFLFNTNICEVGCSLTVHRQSFALLDVDSILFCTVLFFLLAKLLSVRCAPISERAKACKKQRKARNKTKNKPKIPQANKPRTTNTEKNQNTTNTTNLFSALFERFFFWVIWLSWSFGVSPWLHTSGAMQLRCPPW